MKKSTLLVSAIVLSTVGIFAQNKVGKPNSNVVNDIPLQRTCATMDMVSAEELDNMEKWLAPQVESYLNRQQLGINQKVIYTIPVVVHIIHNSTEAVGTGRNILNSRVVSQIDVLNKDFRKTNTDINQVPAMFSGLAADAEVNFCLIQKYPSGHPMAGQAMPEPGVDRVDVTTIAGMSNTTTGYSTTQIDGTIKPATSWNPNQVFNIWVLQLTGGLLGFAQFPNSGAANTDGVAIGYQYFGLNPAANPFHLGRTTTHETGHYLGLRHIWGDANCGNDFVGDTPTQQTSSAGCPVHPRPSCSNTGDNFQNYMDYTDDACMFMFTTGQKTVMQNVMATAPRRSTLTAASTTLCTTAAPVTDDAGISSITSPTGSICSTTINPVVVLKNFGTNTLTSVTINFLIDGVTQTPFSWSGSLATNATASVSLPPKTTTAGSHTFNANTTLPNGVTDGTPANNAATPTSFNIITGGLALPFVQGFEGAYLPSGWTANNPDALTTWAKTTAAAKTGTASVFMDYYNYSAQGEKDEITTPALNLTTVSNPQLTFELAYQLYTDPNDPAPFSDTLVVLISTNCGTSWTEIYRKSSTALTTATPAFDTSEFVPTANQWRKEIISLNAFATTTNALFMFRGISNFENQLYIDDINVDFATSINMLNNTTDINIFPNPATDNINVLLTNAVKTKIEVYNVVGSLVYSDVVLSNVNKIDMSHQPNGVYLVKVTTDGVVTTKKVMLSK